MKLIAVTVICGVIASGVFASETDPVSLRDEFGDSFLIGAALNYRQIQGEDQASPEFIASHFSALTAENAMKWERIHPGEDKYTWDYSDQLAEFAKNNDIHLTGHTLIWHRQTPDWVFEDGEGNATTRELLLNRMESHIRTVVERYKGVVHSWDVLNEALNEDGSLRDSKWRQIIGDDYIQKAYEFAEAADPGAKLYYNDYNLYKPEKRDGAIRLVRSLQDQGVPVHGIGLQAHYGLKSPANLQDVEDSIVAFADAGVDVLITELDVSVLPSPSEEKGATRVNGRFVHDPRFDPYADGLPEDIEREFTERYGELLRIFLTHRDKISRVTFWGVHDEQSWKNNWPMAGRTDYALLFDRNNEPKAVVDEIIALKNRIRDKSDPLAIGRP